MLGTPGIATREQLLASGMTPLAITAAVRSGMLIRLRRAWYARPDTPFEQRIAVALGGRVGAVSAARSYGMWTGLDTAIHVSWVPHGNVAKPGRRLAYPANREVAGLSIVPHWRARDQVPRHDLWRETPGEAIRQTFLSADRVLAVAMADSACRLGLLTVGAAHAILAELPRRFHGLGPSIDGLTDSGLESTVRLWLLESGISFRLHPVLCGLEVDFLIGESLVIETDGREFHTGLAFERDRERDLTLGARGFVVIRLSYRQITENWAGCVDRILAAMARGDHLRPIR